MLQQTDTFPFLSKNFSFTQCILGASKIGKKPQIAAPSV
jgi:hypothetical protein